MRNQVPGSGSMPPSSYVDAGDTEQWEYKIIVKKVDGVDAPAYADPLNQLGAQGWELVSVTPGNAMVKHYVYFFKKRRPGR